MFQPTHYIQQSSHPSKFLEICNNVSPNPIRQKSQEFVWITTIMSGRAKLDQVYLVLTITSQYEKWFLTCLYRSQDLSPLYLLLVQAPDFKSRWCARKILFHQSPPECQHTWAEYKCPLPSMVVHPYRGTWSSFRHWHVWGAADDDEKLDGHSINAWEWMVWNRLGCHESLLLETLRA